MLTENGLQVDMDAVRDVLRRADVLTVGFTTFAERLLIDTRANATTGPMVTLVDPVTTVQERYLWLGRHRGEMGAPEAFSFFVWPHSVTTLVDRDVLSIIRDRVASADPAIADEIAPMLQRLAAMERNGLRAAIRGDEAWQTLWERGR